MTYTKVTAGYQFEITGKASSSSPSYVAGGLSFDGNMVSDVNISNSICDLLTSSVGHTRPFGNTPKYTWPNGHLAEKFKVIVKFVADWNAIYTLN